jgi:biopolymer transport protein ExbD
MAGIDVGGHGGKKSMNHEIPLIPFIDFLLCLVSFLLITAVWSQMARLNADARVPGPPDPNKEIEEKKDKTLHIEMKGDEGAPFKLIWKEGSTVINSIDVPKKSEKIGKDELAFPELAKKIEEEWGKNESRHFAATDPKIDQAVLHTDNSTPFKEVIAVIDAVYAPQRDWKEPSGEIKKRSALNVTFSVN